MMCPNCGGHMYAEIHSEADAVLGYYYYECAECAYCYNPFDEDDDE